MEKLKIYRGKGKKKRFFCVYMSYQTFAAQRVVICMSEVSVFVNRVFYIYYAQNLYVYIYTNLTLVPCRGYVRSIHIYTLRIRPIQQRGSSI